MADQHGTDQAAAPATQQTTEVGVFHDGHQKVFPPFDTTFYPSALFWLTITFGTLYVVLSRIALPRIGDVLEERKDRIQDDLEKARALQSQSDDALKAYETALHDARAKALAIAGENNDKLNSELDAERAAVEKTIAEKTVQAEKNITAAKDAAFKEVDAIASDTTSSIIEALLGKAPKAADIKKALSS